MKRMLPRINKLFVKILSTRFVFTLFIFFISPLVLLFLFKFIFSQNNSSPITIQKFYISKNNDAPNLYIKIRSNSFRNEQLSAYIKLEDKLNNIKKQVDIGDLGTIQKGAEKEYLLSWDYNWEGSGIGNIDLVIKNQEGVIADKTIYLAVLPSSAISLEMLTFMVSGLIGAGFIFSRFA